MKTGATTLVFEKDIKASATDCFRAFTNQSIIESWLCNSANVDARLLTKLYLWWNSGYYVVGEFSKVEPEKEIAFSWLGRNEPGRTRVRVTFKAGKSVTHVRLEHRGIKDTERWAKAAVGIQRGWESALNNLVVTLESGADLRIVNRPMLGINMDDFSPEDAARLGVPVSQGIRLGSVVEGMGAQKSGLVKDDVIVEIAGTPMIGFSSISATLQSKKPGEKIEVVYFHGPEKKTTTVELSPRPMPQIPGSVAELVLAMEDIYRQGDEALAQALDGVTEIESTFKPAPTEWNVREVLAHLIHNERDVQFMLHKILMYEDVFLPNNLQNRIDATVAVYPTLADLKLELKRAESETLAFLRTLPEEFTSRKSSFWMLGYNLLQSNDHPVSHARQIAETVAACRER